MVPVIFLLHDLWHRKGCWDFSPQNLVKNNIINADIFSETLNQINSFTLNALLFFYLYNFFCKRVFKNDRLLKNLKRFTYASITFYNFAFLFYMLCSTTSQEKKWYYEHWKISKQILNDLTLDKSQKIVV